MCYQPSTLVLIHDFPYTISFRILYNASHYYDYPQEWTIRAVITKDSLVIYNLYSLAPCLLPLNTMTGALNHVAVVLF